MVDCSIEEGVLSLGGGDSRLLKFQGVASGLMDRCELKWVAGGSVSISEDFVAFYHVTPESSVG